MKFANCKTKQLLAAAFLLFAAPALAAELINVTGNGVELTYVSVDCNGENEVGITISGTGFVGKQLSSLNCAGGAYAFNEDATLSYSLGISVGDDLAIAAGKTVTGLNNLFGDAAKAGDGTYSDAGSTTLWSAAYADRLDAGTDWGQTADVDGKAIIGKPDIGASESQKPGSKLGMGM